MLAFKLLHILSMFAAVTLIVGEVVFIAVAIWRGDARALAAVRRVTGRRPLVGVAFFGLGIVFGLLTAATGGIDFFAGWLLAAYLLIVVVVAINALPVVQKGLLGVSDMAAEADAGERPVEEVTAAMAALRRPFLYVAIANVLIFMALIVDMVLQPF